MKSRQRAAVPFPAPSSTSERATHVRRRFSSAVLAALAALLVSCLPEDEPLAPRAGATDHQREARTQFPLAGAEGHVDLLGGNLHLRRVDLSADTQLGTLEIGAIYNSATRAWAWTFEPRYGTVFFTDETGAQYNVSGLADGQAVPGTHWVKLDAHRMKTRSGRVYTFDVARRLASVHWGQLASTRLEWVRQTVAGRRRTVAIEQCLDPAPCEPVYRIEHDGEGRVIAIESADGRRAEIDWSNTQLIAARDGRAVAEGREGFRYEYVGGRLSAVTNGDGERTEIVYEARRVVALQRRGEGDPSERFRYAGETDGLYETRHFDPRGFEHVYRYDAERRLHEIWNVTADERKSWTWAGLRPATRTEPDGATHHFVYVDDDLTHERLPSGNVRQIVYTQHGTDLSDPPHRPIARIDDALGPVEAHEYDAVGRLVASSNGAGETTRFDYEEDALRPSRITAPSGRSTELLGYGSHGHPATVIHSTSWMPSQLRRHDRAGNRTHGAPIGSPGPGGVISRVYDASRSLREIALVGGERVEFDVRGDGRATLVSRPRGANHEMEYDGLGRLTARSELADGVWQTTHFEYDRSGNRTATLRPNGMRQETDYDAANRAIRVRSLRDGALEAEVQLDYEQARLVSVFDSSRGGEEHRTYGLGGQVIARVHPEGRSTHYGYDLRGRRTSTTWLEADGEPLRSVEIGYDGAGREIQLHDGQTRVLERSYAGGRLAEVHYDNGLVRTFSYEPEGGPLLATETRNAAGDVVASTSLDRTLQWPYFFVESATTVTGALDAQSLERYELLSEYGEDSAGLNRPRIASTQVNGLFEAMRWDERSNLVAAGDTSFLYNAEANRLLAVEAPGEPPVEYVYDDAGFVTERDGTTLSWHANGRLATHGEDRFEWDALGTLLSSTVDGITTRSAWDGSVTTDAAGQPLRIDLDEVVIDLQASSRLYRHLDFRQNVKFTSDDSGAVTALYSYSAFGLARVDGSAADAVRFVGRSQIGDLVLMGARIYDPWVGRFLSPDPIFQPVNQYAYTLGNPVQFHDRMGTQAVPQSGAGPDAGVSASTAIFVGNAFLLAGAAVALTTANVPLAAALVLTGMILILIASPICF